MHRKQRCPAHVRGVCASVCTPDLSPRSSWRRKSYSNDKCVNYCINYHEWIHFTDDRSWNLANGAFDSYAFAISSELPSYIGEKACLQTSVTCET